MLVLRDWNYKTHNTDTVNLDENKFVYKKNYLWRKRFFEILRSEMCTKWEKWREGKNFELTKSQYKNYKKTMRQYRSSLFSCRRCKSRWILWMIRENFKKWNQFTVGDCPVSSQPAMILCRDKRLPFDTLNISGLQENVFGNQYSTFDSPRDLPQRNSPLRTTKGTRISPTGSRVGDTFHRRWQTK